MRKLVTSLFALTAACATVPAASDPPIPVHGQTAGHVCQAEGGDRFIGLLRSDRTGDAIKALTHAAILRWAPPGIMLTMDFRADRVTVWLDASNTITKIHCG